MSTDLKAIADGLVTGKAKELKEAVDSIHDDLVVRVTNNFLPENIFVSYFLDFFMTLDDASTGTPLGLKWIELAGGVYNEVDIVGPDGNVLYSVPGLFTRPVINDEVFKKIPFSSITSTYESKSNRTYAEGINYLYSTLSNMDKSISGKTNVSDVSRWHNIFKRYYGNVEAKNNLEEHQVTGTISEVKNLSDDDYDYS